jgi:hypothetical protein
MAIERLSKLGGKGDIQEAQSIIHEGLTEEDEEDDEGDEDEGKAPQDTVMAALETSPSEILPKHPSLSLTAQVDSTSSSGSLKAPLAEPTPRAAEDSTATSAATAAVPPVTEKEEEEERGAPPTETAVEAEAVAAAAAPTSTQEEGRGGESSGDEVQVDEVSLSISTEA